MPGHFHEDGIQFLYPENWALSRDDNDSGWTVSVESPDTAFLMVSFDAGMPEPELMADTALEALTEEYKDLEADDQVQSLAGQPAVGYDIRFFSFDLTNTCWIRSFYAAGGTVLVMWQANDLELERNEAVLKAIVASLRVAVD